VSGAGTSLYVVEIGRKFWLKFEGIPPMRNLAFELTDRTKWLELLSSLVPGSRADPFELFRPATVVTWHKPVADFQQSGAVAPAGYTIPKMADGEARHYEYRATSLSGTFTGHLYVFQKSASDLLVASLGFAGEELIHRDPVDYPTVNGSIGVYEPDWPKFGS
jgi:hypothetical protein